MVPHFIWILPMNTIIDVDIIDQLSDSPNFVNLCKDPKCPSKLTDIPIALLH